VHAVHGNVDDDSVRESLPETCCVDLGGRLRIGIVHVPGPRAGREERLVSRFPGCAAIVYGHTHVPHVERHGDVWILNPGSPTERRRAPRRTMLELWTNRDELVPQLIALGP
jgi:uncharacterized protein